MPADVDIVNLALTQLGSQRIVALTDNTKAAKSANAIYALARDNELRAHYWNFATARALLAADSTPPAFGFKTAFDLPADFLRVIQVSPPSLGGVPPNGDFQPGGLRVIGITTDMSDYRIEGRQLLSNWLAPLHLRYIKRVTDTNLFDSTFVKALACRLAMQLAEDLSGVQNKRQMASQEYVEAIKLAVRSNAIELPPDYMPDGSWALSRLPG